MSTPPPKSWIFERRVSVPTLVLLAGNLLLGVWYASNAFANLNEIDRRVTRLEASDGRQNDSFNLISDRLARIEERIIAMQNDQRRSRP